MMIKLEVHIWIFKRLTCPTFVHLTCVSDWMRVGAFCFTSSDAFLIENLICPAKLPKEETMQNMLNAHGSCYLRNIKTGVWIAGNILQKTIL